MEQTTASDEAQNEITATVSVESVLKAIELNATDGVDDRVIAVPQRDGAEASIRRAFRGSERYSNPAQAPVHISPESLVEPEFRRPPIRADVDKRMMDIPNEKSEWTDEDEEAFEDAFEVLIDVWEKDVRGMIEGEHSFTGKGNDITLAAVVAEDD